MSGPEALSPRDTPASVLERASDRVADPEVDRRRCRVDVAGARTRSGTGNGQDAAVAVARIAHSGEHPARRDVDLGDRIVTGVQRLAIRVGPCFSSETEVVVARASGIE